jgi:hypothetical protein
MTNSRPQPLDRGKGGFCILVYGVPGAGKTRFAGSGDRTLIIRPPVDHTDSIPADADVQEWVIDDWSGMLEAFQFLQQGGSEDYDWVWLDSISLIQDALLDDVMVDAIARKPARSVEKGGIRVPEFGPDQGEYKINFDRINKWVRDMVGLAKMGHFNFGITAHPVEIWDPIREEELWAPWVQGKNMSNKICGFMNLVAYLQEVRREGKPTQRLLLTEAPGFVGKDQFQALPELKSGRRGLVKPTVPELTKAIDAARGPARKRKKTKKRRSRRRSR